MDIPTLIIVHAEVAPIITVVNQILKDFGMPSRYSLGTSVIFGILFSWGFGVMPIVMVFVNGIALGAMAVGTYEVVKKTSETIKEKI